MTERETVAGKTTLTYEGIFNIRDMFNLVSDFCKTHGYAFIERKHVESTTPNGKHITLELMLPRKLNDYAKSVIMLRAEAANLQEKSVERDRARKKFHTGKLTMTFEGILETDYEKRMAAKPEMILLRKIFERFAFTSFLTKSKNQLAADVEFLKGQLKAFLNLEKYS